MKDKDEKSVGEKIEKGTLYIVATPIGNLEDVTIRALETLKGVDLIAAENVRHTRGFCNHYGIRTRVTAYNQHNRKSRGPELVRRLNRGSRIALVTNAGTPAISDPGSMLIKMALENNIRVSPIPGPSAAIAALSVCGLQVDRFLFLGFLSNRPGRRRKELRDLEHEKRTMVIFEAPHRVKAMLADLKEILGDRHAVILRELTKLYEEVKAGRVSHLLKELEDDRIKGEFTIVIAGEENKEPKDFPDEEVKKRIQRLMEEKGAGVKEAALSLSRELGLNYRAVYREGLAIKKAHRGISPDKKGEG